MNYKVSKGKPIYGANYDKGGVNFGIFSKNATRVILEIYEESCQLSPTETFELDKVQNKTGDVWHIYVEGLKPNIYYGYRIYGSQDEKNGHRFNPKKLLLDPYAKAISGFYNLENEPSEKYKDCVKSIVIDDNGYDWENDEHPRIPIRDSIIYEMHVGLFTANDNSFVENKGSYKGVLEKIDYLKDLGITAVELLPIFEFNKNELINRNPITGELLSNVWGYNPINFFSPTGNYLSGNKIIGMTTGNQIYEFKDFVKGLHKEGIEVILDVVYNHTGEGNENGPTLSFKGIDNSIYYILEKEKEFYANYSGTGNTFNCSHTVVKELIIDSLRYWVTEMHIDGFRFDLASILGRANDGKWIGDLSLLKEIADDPILSGTKLIAEGWDAAGGYFVGEFPKGWAEWNGKYRDTVRKFIKGDFGQVRDLATRIVGSPDLFSRDGRKPYDSINFITAHDGFTMWDLVSYNEKHNIQNGENNNDGANDNYSWNHGEEGETDDEEILLLRKRQIKNFMVLLMISQGVPMILMGDEFCRTQLGNNNAYCQDNELNWVDWSRKEEFSEIYNFTKKMIRFRKNHHSLKRNHFFADKDINGDGITDISWHGLEPLQPDWSEHSKTLAFMISGNDFIGEDNLIDNDIYVIFNSYHKPLEFKLPNINDKKWFRVVDTYLSEGKDILDVEKLIETENYKVHNRSCAIFISK